MAGGRCAEIADSADVLHLVIWLQYGLTSVDFLPYIGASLLGFLPGTIAYVYSGRSRHATPCHALWAS